MLTGAFAAVTAVLVAASTLGPAVAALAVVLVLSWVILLVLGAYRSGVALLTLAFGTAPFYRGIEGITGGTIPPTDLFLILGTVLLLPRLLQQKLRLPLPFTLGLLAIACCGLLITAVTGGFFRNSFYLGQWLFYLGAMPIVFAWWRPPRATVLRLLWAYLVGHLLSTAWGVAEGSLGNGRYDGLAHHTNAFGVAGAASLAVLLVLFHEYRQGWHRAVLLGLGVVAVMSIGMSGSRAAALVAVGLVLLVPIVERSAVSGFALAIAGALAVFALPFLVTVSGEGSAISRLAGDATAESADREREDALNEGFDQLWESPILGSGFSGVETLHNVYLAAAVAIGVVGLVFYLLVLFVLARPLFSDVPMRRLGYVAWAFVGLGAGLPSLWDRTIWVLMALTILPAISRLTDRDRPTRPTTTERPAASR